MRCLILAAGRFDAAMKAHIAEGKEPRLDIFEIAQALDADCVDFKDVEASGDLAVRTIARSAGLSAALAYLGFQQRKRYDAFFTTGEDIGLPLAALLKPSSAPCSHTMIAHTLFPAKKQAFFKYARVGTRIDRMLVYSTTEERLAVEGLGMAPDRVTRIYYHADERFFRPDDRALEPDLVCAAGQLLRDYDSLITAVRDMPVRVQIAAGSPWIDKTLAPKRALPQNVTWGKLSRYDLRELYARSALAVVPILQNHYQTGIATILEMMAMGKCVIASKTHGQIDTIVDGETGVYVPPGDPNALRQAIQRLLAQPGEAARLGRNARTFVAERAGLDLFAQRIASSIREGNAARSGH